jgi:hypothetical protein
MDLSCTKRKLAGSFFNRHAITILRSSLRSELRNGKPPFYKQGFTDPKLFAEQRAKDGSHGLTANSFRFYFIGCLTQLFTFPSRYLFAIALSSYLVLENGFPRFPQGKILRGT